MLLWCVTVSSRLARFSRARAVIRWYFHFKLEILKLYKTLVTLTEYFFFYYQALGYVKPLINVFDGVWGVVIS